MTDTRQAYVRVTVTRWVSDQPFPGLVEVVLRDARGVAWPFVDKPPMFTRGILTSRTSYPLDATMACTVLGVRQEEGRKVVDISTVAPWSLAAVDGTFEFAVRPEQIISEGATAPG